MGRGIDLGKSIIKKYEGFEARKYKCPAGIETIGYGFTSNVKEAIPYLKHGIISEEDADMVLNIECERIAGDILERDSINSEMKKFREGELGALISFVYNVGFKNYSSSTLYRLINQVEKRDIKKIEEAFKMWNKATIGGKKQELKGLTKRRAEEYRVFCLGLI